MEEEDSRGSREQSEDVVRILSIYIAECGDKIPPPSFAAHIWYYNFSSMGWSEFAKRISDFTYNYIVLLRDTVQEELDDPDAVWEEMEYFESHVPKEPYSCYEYVYNHIIAQLLNSFLMNRILLGQAINPESFFAELDDFLNELEREDED